MDTTSVKRLNRSYQKIQKPHKVGSGLKLAGAGVVAGTAALIAAPVIAAKEDGVSGFFKGLATGVCGAVGLTLGGVVAGATQVARGRCESASPLDSASGFRIAND